MVAETDARWVPVAVSADIPDGTVVPARLPTGPIAVWRSDSGRIYANGDRCPHRGMRLSHGFVRGESLSCIYHGWRFGSDGACQKIPAHPAVVPPKTINCGALPAIEALGIVWAAVQTPTEAPPDFESYEAVRSLVIAATPDAVARACDAELNADTIKTQCDGHDVVLLVTATVPEEVFVIVLVDKKLNLSDRIAVSTGLEALRRTAEAKGYAA